MKKLLIVMWALALLVGCSSEAPKPAEPAKPKPPDILTGRYAFQKMYVSARGWARDAQPFRLESETTSAANGQDGKATVWRASFASPAQHGVKPYIWTGTDAPDAPRGINSGIEDTYNPNNSSTKIFEMAFLKVDSDQALETSKKHGGDKILEKTPDTPVQYRLEWNHNENQLMWHVIYGSTNDPKLRVAIDASTGNFLRVEK
jgi:hypothetical protein